MKSFLQILLLILLLHPTLQSQCWQQATTGIFHTTALTTVSTLWTWGWNLFGQLGNGNTQHQNTPIQ